MYLGTFRFYSGPPILVLLTLTTLVSVRGYLWMRLGALELSFLVEVSFFYSGDSLSFEDLVFLVLFSISYFSLRCHRLSTESLVRLLLNF